jgi:hypothetical protein
LSIDEALSIADYTALSVSVSVSGTDLCAASSLVARLTGGTGECSCLNGTVVGLTYSGGTFSGGSGTPYPPGCFGGPAFVLLALTCDGSGNKTLTAKFPTTVLGPIKPMSVTPTQAVFEVTGITHPPDACSGSVIVTITTT